MAAAEDRIALVSMPFGPLFCPSLALGLLKAELRPLNLPTKIFHYTLRFAELIGTPFYFKVALGQPSTEDLVGEWLFSQALFSPISLDREGYIDNVLRKRFREQGKTIQAAEELIQEVQHVSGKVEAFLEECTEELVSYNPAIVGFSSVFHQHIASLALAKRLKAAKPETFVVFGGANCQGIMGSELIGQFSFVDVAVSGDGDLVFPMLVKRVLDGEPIVDLQGVYTRNKIGSPGQAPVDAPMVLDLDSLPFPDYDDFFQQQEIARLDRSSSSPRLVFEASRGCWWGEKQQCTFCGLNGAAMRYRSKSARRVLEELLHLVRRHSCRSLDAVDNILNMKYFEELLPELSRQGVDLDLFFEVKANLRKDQVRLLRDAGIKSVQPGVESFSDSVLRLMKKGTNTLQNIQLLKWCKEFGIKPLWYFLFGFPNESPNEYASMAANVIPLISHLPPPMSFLKVRLVRFSPNFEYAEKLGFADVNPSRAYSYIYPFAPDVIANMASFFDFGYAGDQDVEEYAGPVKEMINLWKDGYHQSDLFSVDKEKSLVICDLRPAAKRSIFIFRDLEKELYLYCDSVRTVNQITQFAQAHLKRNLLIDELNAILDPMVSSGLLMKNGDSYIALALPLGEYSPKKPVLEKLSETFRKIGNTADGSIIIDLDTKPLKVKIDSESA